MQCLTDWQHDCVPRTCAPTRRARCATRRRMHAPSVTVRAFRASCPPPDHTAWCTANHQHMLLHLPHTNHISRSLLARHSIRRDAFTAAPSVFRRSHPLDMLFQHTDGAPAGAPPSVVLNFLRSLVLSHVPSAAGPTQSIIRRRA